MRKFLALPFQLLLAVMIFLTATGMILCWGCAVLVATINGVNPLTSLRRY